MPSGKRMRSPALALARTSRPSELLPIGTNTENDSRFGGIGVSPTAPPSRIAPAPIAKRSITLSVWTLIRFEALAKP
jgi:hypothetical protein